MPMFLLLTEHKKLEDQDGDHFEVLTFVEHGEVLEEKLAEYAHLRPTVWMAKHWADLNGEALMIMRRLISHAGIESAYADDACLGAVVELLELRRRFNDGKALDLSGISDEPFCQDCQLPKEHHDLPTVKCKGYVWRSKENDG